MAYIYKHIRKDTNEVFYIGIGSDSAYKRAYSNRGRNDHWKKLTNKVGYAVEIIEDDIDWETACMNEIKLILEYGRTDLGTGCLVNKTDGGDGHKNPSLETRLKISKGNKGKIISEEAKEAIRKSNKNREYKLSSEHLEKLTNSKIGKKYTEEHKLNISLSKLGKKRKPFSEETKIKMREASIKRELQKRLIKQLKNEA
jgi:hypothetical protein